MSYKLTKEEIQRCLKEFPNLDEADLDLIWTVSLKKGKNWMEVARKVNEEMNKE